MNINTISRKQMILASLAFFCGILFFLLRYEWIILRIPRRSHYATHDATTAILKKKLTLYFWHHNTWQTETEELIWSDRMSTNIQTISNALLRLLEQEQMLKKRIKVESVACTPSAQECYISFDRNPLDKEWSTLHAWMFIESILRTIRENGISCEGIYFLVRHQPLIDQRLDFSHAWPLGGFSSN